MVGANLGGKTNQEGGVTVGESHLGVYFYLILLVEERFLDLTLVQ